MQAPGGTLWGYPKGVFLLSFTELWERFSYYGMLALLVLFLTEPVLQGGFGWSRPEALKLYGFYTGLIFTAPLLGGWIANSYWGERRCILVGGVLLVFGHLCLGSPAAIPSIVQWVTGAQLQDVWVRAQIPLGMPFISAESAARLSEAAHTVGVVPAVVMLTYQLVACAFLGGLFFIAAGTALLKPTISSIVGRFFSDGDARRDGAFALFFVGVYIGGLSASLIVGFLGERVAWHWGFSAAGFGMAVGLVTYLWKQHAYLAQLGLVPVRDRSGGGVLRGLSPEERDRVKAILLQGVFTVAYAAAFYQKGGLLTLFARENLNRSIGGWEIPVTWFLTISTATFILVTPLAARLWLRLAERGVRPSAPQKLAWGLISIGIGYVVISIASSAGAERAWWGWLALTYVFFGIGDALVWPTQISMVSRLAPKKASALFVGGWYVTIGLGSWLTGYIGALGYTWGMVPVFICLAAGTVALGLLLWAISPRFQRLAHGLA
jgi:proton-dependent oligopeptide transporter, POT family